MTGVTWPDPRARGTICPNAIKEGESMTGMMWGRTPSGKPAKVQVTEEGAVPLVDPRVGSDWQVGLRTAQLRPQGANDDDCQVDPGGGVERAVGVGAECQERALGDGLPDLRVIGPEGLLQGQQVLEAGVGAAGHRLPGPISHDPPTA